MSGAREKTLYLSDLAGAVIEIIRESKQTTFSEVADKIVSGRSSESDDPSNKTARRRVYDALNVLVAAGLVVKDKKQISYNVRTENPMADHSLVSGEIARIESRRIELRSRIESLENAVITKARTLLLYRALVERNFRRSRPVNATLLPAMFIGFPKAAEGETERTLDGKRLVVRCEQGPIFYSPSDILDKMSVGVEKQRAFVRSAKDLAGLEKLVFYSSGALKRANNV